MSKARHFAATLLMAGSLAVLPAGVIAAPAAAYPAPIGQQWSYDCDHTGPWQWQQNRGQWQWGNCDANRGRWVWIRDNSWQWNYYPGYNNWYQAPPPPPRVGVPFFGSS